MLSATQIGKIGIYTDNYDAVTAFYRDTLGLPVAWDNADEKHTGFRVGQNLVVVQHAPGKAHDTEAGWRLYLTVHDIAVMRAQLADAGVNVSDVHEYDGFKTVDFTDPEGNRLGLFEPTEAYAQEIAGYMAERLDD